MSKAKKGSKASAETSNWEEGLLNEAVDDDCWSPCLVFLAPDQPLTEPHLQALVATADGGNRRKFAVIDKESMLQSAREDAKLASASAGGGGGKKSKQGSAAPVEKPLHVEVCERVVSALQGGGVPPALVAKMLKYKILRRRTQDIAMDALKKEAEEASKQQKPGTDAKGGKKGVAGSGRTSKMAGSGRTSKMAGGKKGKETPAMEATPAVSVPQKPATSMKKRGEEDLDAKYIDDEPAGGPSCYFLLTGFTSAEVFQHLTALKLTAHALVRVKGQEETCQTANGLGEEEEISELQQQTVFLQQFWEEINHSVKATPSGSMLRDMARLDLEMTQVGVPDNSEEKVGYGQSLFDTLAHRIYLLLEQRKQYQHYISYLDIFSLPLGSQGLGVDAQQQPAEVVPTVDMRWYKALMGCVPDSCCSIPLMLHCMVEQVSATLSGGKSLLDSQSTVNGVDPAIMAGINNSIAGLALPAKEKQELLSDDAKSQLPETSCVVLPSGDDSTRRLFHLQNSPQLQIPTSENATNHLSILMSILTPPVIPCEEAMKQSAKLHSLEHLCLSSDISRTFLSHALILLSLEHIHLSNASTAPMLCSHEEQQVNTNLLFDYPFSFSLKENSGTSKALVPVSEATDMVSSDPCEGGVDTLSSHQCDLDLPEPHYSLERYSFCELLKKEVLLQLLQSLQQTHPYIEVFHHHQSQSVVLVVHTGFDGNPIHKYEWSSQAHSRVGFHHYLEHVAENFGSLVDKAVAYDVERKKAYDAEKQKLIEQKLEAVKQEEEASPSNDDPKSSAKGSKKGSAVSSAKKTPSGSRATPGKKNKLGSKECTPAVSTHDVTASFPEFEEQKLFPAYDVGDTVLLTKGSVTTQFTADGSQIRTEHCQFVEGPMKVNMSLLNRGHTITASLVWQGDDQTKNQEVESKDNTQIANDGEKEDSGSEDGEKPPPVVIAGIPQPPPSVAFAFLYASFNNSLSLALSQYGPKGNGERPYNPPRPNILDRASRPDSSLGSRPQSRQGASSQKLSKKQQEQQQQLLEQQRLLEEQRDKERKAAKTRFQEQQNAISRHNKYQQLFASMPYGLQVHCQSMVDLEADASLSDGSDGCIVVRQSYVTKTKGMQRDEEHLLKAAFTEKQRYYLPGGLVVRILLDDAVIIECTDGSIYRTATQREAEHFTQAAASVKDQGMTPELENVLTEAPARIESATKVSFADTDKVAALEKPKTMETNIWVVTSSSGQKYLWKLQEESSTTVAASQTAEEGNGPMEEEESGRQEQSDPVGQQCQIVPLPKVGSLPATDPVTKEALIIREDGVTLLYRPDGSCIAEHTDGTRFTTCLSPLQKTATSPPTEKPTEIVVECPGFARVVYHSESRNCKLHFPDGSEIACSRDGSYTVSKLHDYLLQIASSGKAVFTPTEGMQRGKPTSTFTIDHTGSSEILNGSDLSGNTFIVGREGQGSVDLGGGSEIPKHPAFDPRYFVVHADGTSLELLKDDSVSSVIMKAKSNTRTVVLHEDVPSEPHCTSTTVLEPCEGGGKSCLVPYEEESIVPVNLRASQFDSTHSDDAMQKVNGVLPGLQGREGRLKKKKFGVGVGKGLIIGSYEKPPAAKSYIQPEAIQFRQFLHMQPVSNSLRMQLLSGIAAYTKWCQKQDQKGESVQPVDERDDEEKLAAEELQAKWCSHLTNEAVIEKTELPTKYRQEVTKESDQISTKPVTKVHKATGVNEAVKWELEEAKATRQALRHRHIPPYFESKDGKQYLRSQSPDLKFLASKLAHPRHDSKQSASGHSTPSTLHSVSMTIPHEELESPTQSEIDDVGPVSSLSNLRPSHPTPDHAQGNATPTELRPTNPTPSHALKVAVGSAEEPLPTSNDTNSFTAVKPTNMEDICTSKRADIPENHEYVAVTNQLRSSGKTENSAHRVCPKEKPNTKFAVVEEPVRRKVHTSSTSGVGAVRGFLLQPEEVDFGVLSEGCTYAFTVVLKNTGIDSCRFKIKQPPPSTGVKVIYTPGPVAAGMSRSLVVEIFAMAVGVVGECGVGSVQHEVEIVSEATVMYLPVKATILTSSAYKDRLPAHPQGRETAGVRIISDCPTSRETLTRPQRSIS